MNKLGNFLSFINSDLLNFYNAIKDTHIMGYEASNVKEKPILFQGSESMLGNINMSASDYVVYKKETEGYKLLGRSGNPYREVQKIDSHLKILGVEVETMSADRLYKITRLLFKEESRSYRLISVMKGDSRRVNSYTEMLNFLEYNTHKFKRMILKNKNAVALDWERKIKQGNIPKVVTDYMKCYWACYILNKHQVLDEDIYHFDMKKYEQELASKIPTEWKLLVLSATDTEGFLLTDLSYWSYWSKEQIKIGNKWYGKGEIIMKFPEAILKIQVDNGVISKLFVETDYKGVFSVTTCW